MSLKSEERWTFRVIVLALLKGMKNVNLMEM